MSAPRPVTILIAALGGDGGGVLTDWIVRAAEAWGYPAQATQIPGVAQRTGATTYYIEVVPQTRHALGGAVPVLALNPAMGEVDLALATELVEAGRMVGAGWTSPERTTLIGSTHRQLAIGERVAMGDGKFDEAKLNAAIAARAKERVFFDLRRAAEEAGCAVNAVLLGAMAGSGRSPLPDEALELAIRNEGKSVEANLAGFAAGRALARGERAQQALAAEKRTAQARAAADPLTRARAEFDGPALATVEEGVRRLTHYQDVRYARLYLDRLRRVAEAERAAGGDGSLLQATAKHLAVRMSFEDVIRVAQAKVAPDRMARVRAEVRARPGEPVQVVEHFKPGIEEIADVLPPSLARALLRLGERRGWTGRVYVAMRVRTFTVLGFARLRLLAGMRWWRPRTWRYVREQAQLERWLDQIVAASARSLPLAREIVEGARLIKGYGDTHKRGLGNWERIDREIVGPALAGLMPTGLAADALASARVAALADPEGQALTRALSEVGARATELPRAAE